MFCHFEGFWSEGSPKGIHPVLQALESPPQISQYLGPAASFLPALLEFMRELPMCEAKDGPVFDFFYPLGGLLPGRSVG
eukprot:294194-Pyramimonas_sp.AAC.1